MREMRQAPWPRRWAPRLSIPMSGDACDGLASLATLQCPGPHRADPDRSARLAGALRAHAAATPDADVLQAAALLDLVSGDTTQRAMRRSIALLEMAVRLGPSASRYSDLAAARLAYGASHDDAKSVVEALDATGRALELRPADAAALYNHALALDVVGLDAQAVNAWQAVIAADSASVLAAEARARLVALAHYGPPHAPAAGAPLAAYRQFASAAPSDAQSFAWDTLLRQWGQALLDGDTASATRAQAAVAAVGGALADAKRDASVSAALGAITSAKARPAALRSLAVWHVQFAKAQDLARQNAYAVADTIYGALAAARPPSQPLLTRAVLAHVNALIYAKLPDSALAESGRFLRRHEGGDAPLLHARAHWYAGVLLLRRQLTDSGLAHMQHSRPWFDRAGDAEGVAGTIGVEAEALFQSGDVAGGYDRSREALLLMRGRAASLWRHNQLLVLGRAAARQGLPYAARAIEDEDAAGAETGTRLVSVIEARLQRARSAWMNHRAHAARGMVDSVRALIGKVPDQSMRERLGRDVDLATSGGLLATAPDSAATLLSRVIAVDAPLNYPGRLIPALVMRAAANLALDRTELAERDLDSAAVRFDAARAALRSAGLQRTIVREARSVYDSLVMMRVRRGDAAGALAALERSRVSFGAVPAGPPDTIVGVAATAAIDYALIGNTLLTWTVVGRDTLFRHATIDRTAFAERVERVRVGLETGVPEAGLRRDLASLYDVLIRPSAERLAANRLRVVPDGEIAQVPFAALWNAERGRYLVEGHATSLSPTLAHALRGAAMSPIRGGVLVISSPALDGSRFAGLPALPAAEGEAEMVARQYPGSVVIRGAAADSVSVSTALAGAELVHFAGHAILDDAQPWRSVLALKPRGISASAVARMDLRRMKLAVLSACETMRSADDPTGGFAGLTDAFMAAGAGGVVGSLWRVGDEDAASLMKSFHRALYGSGDAAQALRVAQLALLRAHRPPGAWAAFRYAGR